MQEVLDMLIGRFWHVRQLLFAGSVLIVLQWLLPSVRAQRARRTGSGVDLAHAAFNPIFVQPATLIALLGVEWTLFLVVGNGEALQAAVASLPFAAQVALAVFIGDFAAYWRHRAMHSQWLWPIHAVHHSSTEVDWLSTLRFHPLNQVITQLVLVAVLIPLGFTPGVILTSIGVRGYHGYFLHTNTAIHFGPLDRVFVSPRVHRWHHSVLHEASGKNFAPVFSFWDVLFGTFYRPVGVEPHSFGLGDEPMRENYFMQLAYPFERRTAPEDRPPVGEGVSAAGST